jgi:hypothetical protein
MSENSSAKLLTITAFLIGFALIDELNSTEQGALGNFFMLMGQTLCTNSSEYFKRDWNNFLSGNNVIYTNSNTSSKTNTKDDADNRYNNQTNNYTSDDRETDREYTLRMLNKTKEIFEKEINNLK